MFSEKEMNFNLGQQKGGLSLGGGLQLGGLGQQQQLGNRDKERVGRFVNGWISLPAGGLSGGAGLGLGLGATQQQTAGELLFLHLTVWN